MEAIINVVLESREETVSCIKDFNKRWLFSGGGNKDKWVFKSGEKYPAKYLKISHDNGSYISEYYNIFPFSHNLYLKEEYIAFEHKFTFKIEGSGICSESPKF